MRDVADRVDLIIAWTTPGGCGRKAGNKSDPCSFLATADPVRSGLVSDLARPRGNLTGVSFDVAPTVYVKNLQLLKEAIPSLRLVAVLIDEGARPLPETTTTVRAAASAHGLELSEISVQRPLDLEPAVRKAKAQGAQALYVWPSGLTRSFAKELAALAAANRLPSFQSFREGALAGGLLAYAPSFTDIGRRGAMYVDKILRGTKPADLPRRTAHQVRTCRKPQDRQGARPHDPALAPAAGGPGNRVMGQRPTILADLEDFVGLHGPHGELCADAGEPAPNDYRLTVACACGVTFHRWVTAQDAPEDLAALARCD
jgi:hypothetical protein